MQEKRSGGLDSRTLIAFALMILVWVAFTQFFGPKKQPTPPSSVATEEAGGPSAEAVAESPVPASPVTDGQASRHGWGATVAPASAADGTAGWQLENRLTAQEEDVVVENELYRAVFSTRGGALRSWTLKEFTDAAGQRADLVPSGGTGALTLQLTGPEGAVDLSRTLFSVEQSGTEGAQLLRFVAEGPIVWDAAGSGGEEGQEQPAAVRVERIYRFRRGAYDLDMDLAVSGVANPRLDHGIVLGWPEGIPGVETQEGLDKQAKAAVALLGEEFVKDGFGGSGFGCSCGGGKAAQGGERNYEGLLRWAGVRAKYFAGLVIPAEEEPATFIAMSRPELAEVGMRLVRPLAEDGRTEQRYRVYIGPIDAGVLKELEAEVDRDVTRLVDYGGKLIAPISKATHWFLLTVHRVVPNYGLVILILAIVVRVIFHPLTVKSMQSQRKLQQLKPELDAINAKYKDNPEQRTKKTMELHKRHGVNPLGGCLPLLVQMPVIYALYNVLMNAMELRKAPFVLWMNDLSSPDTVGHVMGIPINVLPLLMAATMFWQQKLTPTDPRQAPMLIMMPLLMVFFFYGLPSGLVLYWTITNLLAVAQQMLMKPQMEPATAAPGPSTTPISDRREKRARA